MRAVISGYYGFGNVGDEAVLAGMLAALRARVPEAQITVLSGDPAQTRQVHGVAAVSRSIGAVRAIAGADVFISGGGSLIQDVTSARSAVYYLALLGLATVLARSVMVYAQGVGPLRRWWVRKLVGLIVNRVDLVTVRDEDSRRLLQDVGVQGPIHLTADPAFALEPAPRARIADLLSRTKRPRIGLVLRPWAHDQHLAALLDGVRAACGDLGAEVLVLAFHPARDLRVCADAGRALGAQVLAGLSAEEAMAAVGTLDLLVGMRLHALIWAVALGVPPVALVYDPKIAGLIARIGEGETLSLESLHADQVRRALLAAWEGREQRRSRLLEQAAALREDALRAADLAAALLTTTASPRRRSPHP